MELWEGWGWVWGPWWVMAEWRGMVGEDMLGDVVGLVLVVVVVAVDGVGVEDGGREETERAGEASGM